MGEVKQLTAIERQYLFNKYTKRMIDTYPSKTLPENGQVRFDLDKVDLTSKIYLVCEGTFDAIHASAETYTAARFAPYSLLTKITVQMNNQFTPYAISGKSAYIMKLTERNPSVWTPNSTSTTRTANILTLVSDTDGGGNENQTCKFLIELPLMLNDRDVNGILMTQDQQTQVTIIVDTDNVLTAILGDASGYTTDNVSFTIYPIIERFTIPPVDQAIPDIRQIKEVDDQVFTLSNVGENEMEILTGGTIRRIWLDFYDSTDGYTDAEMTNLAIYENKNTRPWNLKSRDLMIKNQIEYGAALPQGVYCLDFATQGVPNYGGSRDWIDTDKLSRLTINPTITQTGSCRVTVERLRRLVSAK
jgi:hypothetical protein